jgi:hypothetical protein
MFRTSPRNQMLRSAAEREVLPDEVGFAIVEVGRQPALDLVEQAPQQGGLPRAARARRPGSPPFWLCRSRAAVPAPLTGIARRF